MQENLNEQDSNASTSSRLIARRYNIDFSYPLPSLHKDCAKAYLVEDTSSAGNRCFAYIPNDGAILRTNEPERFVNMKSEGVLPLLAVGRTYIANERRSALALIYELPLGGALASNIRNISGRDIASQVITPLLKGIEGFEKAGLAHRGIRLNNVFFMNKGYSRLVLGDCLIEVPGKEQPLVYEPIERGVITPSYRGVGNVDDDIYALGILAFHVYKGETPLKDLKGLDLVCKKAECGTYIALAGDGVDIERNINLFFRGTLCDSKSQRWSIATCWKWLNNARVDIPPIIHVKRSSNIFEYGGKEINSLKQLACEISKKPRYIHDAYNDNLIYWIKNEINEPELSKELSSLQTFGKDKTYLLAAKTCLIIDPEGPIRYKSLNFHLDAMGYLIYDLLNNDNRMVELLEIIKYKLPLEWADRQRDNPKAGAWSKDIVSIEHSVNGNNMGNGIEFILYKMLPGASCLSPLFRDEFVYNIRELLPTLDKISPEADQSKWPVDKHIIAFIRSRIPRANMSPYLNNLWQDSSSSLALVGLLALYSMMQKRYKSGSLPNLSKWFGSYSDIFLGIYHNKKTRDVKRALLRKVSALGDLSKFYSALANSKEINDDNIGFRRAKEAYSQSLKEDGLINNDIAELRFHGQRLGEQIATTISVTTSIGFITGYLFYILADMLGLF